MPFKVVIPARYASARLPAKPLLDIGGRPMIQWVIEAALQSGADEVLVATDDARIAAVAIDPRSGQSIAAMTGSEHLSGTDRIAEVARQRGWSRRTIVVNVQGDEPLLPPVLVGQVAALLEQHADAAIATLSTPVNSLHEFLDPNVVKVVTSREGTALYFSRAPIPWNRDGAPQGLSSQVNFTGAQRHLGIYAYRVEALEQVTALLPGELELTEKLEQLRALQAGMKLVVAVASAMPPAGVDTESDLIRVRAVLGVS
ncbi:MAG: 3-deoxy-manno-octulosonate cytidylyltransferase [Steroidobacter sp.]|nr:3-deoxy-manno-octulosonate cytidylyltransferase [Steroidobacter sp.]